LGYLIKKNKLGITFETENVNDLTRAISDALNAKFRWNEDAEKYRLSLTPERFLKDYQMLYDKVLNIQNSKKNYVGGEKFE
jgi:N12 class adenine-specific DNA methylase